MSNEWEISYLQKADGSQGPSLASPRLGACWGWVLGLGAGGAGLVLYRVGLDQVWTAAPARRTRKLSIATPGRADAASAAPA